MRISLDFLDLDMWEIIENDPFIPTMKVKGRQVPKIKIEFTPNERCKLLFDKRAKYVLYYSLSINDINRDSNCVLAKEIWNTLVVTFEGTEHGKDS